MTTGSGGRLAGLDALKACAIFGVVLIHAAPIEPSLYHQCVVNGVARLAVPAFLIVTGFLVGLKQAPRQRFRASFFRFFRLHLIYGLFYWGVAILHQGALATPTFKSVALHFGERAWPGQFYFVILIQIFLIAGFLVPPRVWRMPATLAVTALLAVAGAVALARVHALPEDGVTTLLLQRTVGSGSGAWLWLFYFTVGTFLGSRHRSGRLPGALRDPRVALALLAGGVAVAAVGWPPGGASRIDPYVRSCIYLGATLTALAIPALADRGAPALLRRLGAASFGVFVFNPALLMAIHALAGPATTAWVSWLHAALVVAVAVPLTDFLRRHVPAVVP